MQLLHSFSFVFLLFLSFCSNTYTSEQNQLIEELISTSNSLYSIYNRISYLETRLKSHQPQTQAKNHILEERDQGSFLAYQTALEVFSLQQKKQKDLDEIIRLITKLLQAIELPEEMPENPDILALSRNTEIVISLQKIARICLLVQVQEESAHFTLLSQQLRILQNLKFPEKQDPHYSSTMSNPTTTSSPSSSTHQNEKKSSLEDLLQSMIGSHAQGEESPGLKVMTLDDFLALTNSKGASNVKNTNSEQVLSSESSLSKSKKNEESEEEKEFEEILSKLANKSSGVTTANSPDLVSRLLQLANHPSLKGRVKVQTVTVDPKTSPSNFSLNSVLQGMTKNAKEKMQLEREKESEKESEKDNIVSISDSDEEEEEEKSKNEEEEEKNKIEEEEYWSKFM